MKSARNAQPLVSPHDRVPGKTSLRANTFWSVAGNVGYLATQWALLSILAKAGGADLVGVYSFALALTAPLMMFAAMRQRLLQATDTSQVFTFQQYWGTRLVTAVAALAGLVILSLVATRNPDIRLVVWWVGIAKAIDLFSQTCQGLWQQHDRMKLIAISRCLNGGVTMLAVGVGVWLHYPLAQVMFLSAVVSLVVVLFFDIPWVIRLSSGKSLRNLHLAQAIGFIKPDFNRSAIRRLLVLGLPLAVASSLVSLDANLPRLIIAKLLDESALGIYSGLAYTTLAGGTIVDAVGNAVSPTMSRMYHQGNIPGLKRLSKKLALGGFAFAILALALAAAVGKPVVTLAYSSEFAEHMDLLFLLLLATGIQFSSTILTYGMTASRSLGSQAYVQVVSLIFGVVFYLAFVHWLGLFGAGIAAIVLALLRLILFATLWKAHLGRTPSRSDHDY